MVLFSLSFFLSSKVIAEIEPLVSTIKVSSSSFDFGNVLEGEKVTAHFQIENTGNAPLNIINFIPSCGCLVAKLDSQIIPAGAILPISAEFDTRGFSGFQSQQIAFNTDNLEQKQVLFTIQGNVEPELLVEPDKIFISQIAPQELLNSPELKFKVSVNTKSKATITDLIDLSQLVEIKDLKISSKQATFVAKYLLPTKSGLFRDRLSIILKDGSQKSYNVPIFIKVEDQLEITPPALSFGLIQPGGKITKKLKIKFQKELQLKILSLTSENPAISAELDPKLSNDNTLVVNVTIDPDQVQENILTDLILTTNQADLSELRVNVFATIPPILED